MAHIDAGVGGASNTEGGGASEIGRKWIGSKAKRRGGGRGTVFNHRIDPELRIIDNPGSIIMAARSENLRPPHGGGW